MATYTPQSGDTLIPGAQAVTELLSPVGGFIAGCGQASLLVIAHLVNGTPISAAQVTAVIKDSITHGASPTGVSTPAELMATANDLGTPLTSVNWQTALAQDAGVTPIELGVSNARAFGGADTTVQGHYITIVGRTAQGNYIVSDPNTQASVSGGFVTYTPAQIASAQPFWAAIPQASSTIGGAFSGVGGVTEGAIAGGISSGLQSAASGVGQGLLGGVGVKSLPDLLWRLGLIVVGVVIVVLAGMALMGGEAQEGVEELTGGSSGSSGSSGQGGAQAAQVATKAAEVAE